LSKIIFHLVEFEEPKILEEEKNTSLYDYIFENTENKNLLEQRFVSNEKALKPNPAQNYNREAKRREKENKHSNETAIGRLSIINQKSKFQEVNKVFNSEQEKGENNTNIEYISNIENLNNEINNVIISSSNFEKKENILQKDNRKGTFNSYMNVSISNKINESIMKKIDDKTKTDCNLANKSNNNATKLFFPGGEASKANNNNNYNGENNNLKKKMMKKIF